MGIRINNRGIESILYNNRPILAVYVNGQKVWPEEIIPIDPIIDEILSCYYNGYWIDEYPWTDDTPWTD